MHSLLEFVQSLLSLLNLPGVITDNVVAFFEKNGAVVPVGAKPWFALIISLFVCVMPWLYDRLRGTTSKFLFSYGLLYSILSVLVLSMDFVGHRPTIYDVKGSVSAYGNDVAPQQHVENFSSTAGCAERVQPTRRICAPDFDVQSHSIRIQSANCGSHILSDTPDLNDKKCVVVQESVQGCGEDNILGIRNCRGRGWLEYQVVVRSSDPPLRQLLRQQFSGPLAKNTPYGKVFDPPQSTGPVLWRYRAIVSQGENQLAVLTEQATSSDLFRSTLTEDGYLRIDVVEPGQTSKLTACLASSGDDKTKVAACSLQDSSR